MLRRLSFIITLIAALGVGVGLANDAAQKDKAKSKDQTESKEQKEKDKTLFESPGLFGVELGAGGGGYLGVYLEEVTPERTKELGLKEERGAVVMKVVGDSPAEKSGLKENDVIVSFNGRRIDSVRELQRLLNETPADRTVQIEVIRGGSRQVLATTLAKRSLQSFKMLGPGLDDQFIKRNQEAMKRAEESLKQSEEELKRYQELLKPLPPNFGDFAFVNPGEFAFFSGPRLGITAESLTAQLAEFFGVKDGKGVLVASVDDNSPAAKAGIKAGDVIIAVDNERVDSGRAMIKALSGKTEGTVSVKIVRNHAEQTINVTLEKRVPATPRRRAVVSARQSSIG
ncbi:MAG: PDZ domain-containing protein [Acidobacteriota bacterium]